MLAKYFFYRLKIGITFCFLLFLAEQVSAQQRKFDELINKIDSLTSAGLPKSALKEVEKLDLLSRQNHNAPQQIRAAVYRMNLQTYLEENALVAIINRLKIDIKQAAYPVKPVLQSILAEVFWKYYQQNRYQFSRRSAMEKPDADFTRWDLKTIIREVGNLYKQSLQNAQKEQSTPIAVLEGVLQGDKSTRYLRPTLYDLLAQRVLDFYLQEEPELPKPQLAFSLNDPRFFGEDAVFINLKLAQNDTASVTYQGIKLLQQASIFHLQKKQSEALADLDLQRLAFLYRKVSFPQKDSIYVDALQKVNRDFEGKAIAADALVLLAQHFQQKDSLVTALSYLQKAIKTYPESLGGKNATLLLKQINQQSLSAEIESVNLPNQAILAKLNYQNLRKANALVYRLSEEDLIELRKHENQNYRYQDINLNTDVLAFIKNLKPVQQQQINLPDPKDYRQHHLEFKIDPLKPGFYVLLLSGENLQDNSLISLTGFRVSNLAYVGRQNPDGSAEITTLDRTIGKPLKDVHITIQESTNVSYGLSDVNGKFAFNKSRNSNVHISLSVPGDFYTDYNNIYGAVFFADNYPREQTILFTDRQLYRPGQTIYFKGLQIITKNGKSEIVKDEVNEVKLEDNNGKNLGSVKVKTNEFGTFSGSFVLPQALLNGNVFLKTSQGAIFVKVEEYKRPSFQLNFDVVKEAYHPGDSVRLKGKVLAFSGYGLAGAILKVNIKLSNQIRFRGSDFSANPTIDFLSDTIKTNSKGEFTIRFKTRKESTNQTAVYRISADATDASGETHSGSATIDVASQALQISLNLPQKVLPADSLKLQTSLTNLNNQLQNGSLQVKIFSLKKPDEQITKNRLWDKPDQFLWNREEFKKLFPTYAWKNEDEFSSWPKDKQVAQLDLKTDTVHSSVLDLSTLKQQLSGIYRIEIAGKNSIGDTVSIVQFTELLSQITEPITMQDWAVPLITKAAPGGKVVFGLMPDVHVLVEVLDGKKILSSEWLYTGKKEISKEIEVPINASNSFRVQLLMVKDNRVYSLYQPIQIIKEIHPLLIKQLTFRNKLQPGEKEQWKLQVSGNEKQSVEMLAAMYDASLDDLAPAQNWIQQTQGLNQQYHPNYFAWNTYNFVNQTASRSLFYRSKNYRISKRRYETLNLFGFDYFGGYNRRFRLGSNRFGFPPPHVVADEEVGQKDQKGDPNADIRIDEAVGKSSLNEVVMIRGTQTKTDMVEYKASTYSVRNPPDVAQSIQVIDNYGDQANLTRNNPITIRKNFNETAFFYPQLKTNEKGEILIDFTIPEALTKWRFKALAQTPDLKFAYLENEVITQKQLMVSATMPRFFREGDTIMVSAIVANLDTKKVSVKTALSLFNGMNMQPVKLLADISEANQTIEIEANTNKAVSFKLIIPPGLDALTYRLTADAGKYSDGEENTIPILPNAMLITESVPMMVRANQTKTFTLEKLLHNQSSTLQNKTLTLEYTENPAWYAVQALPYLMEYPYECAEQTFSRYFANSLATSLVKRMPVIQQVFERWKTSDSKELLSNLEKNQELKSVLIEETPWLRDAQNESEQKKRIALLFDLNKMSYELQLNLDKLKQMQLADGSFPWFTGLRSDRYITQYILAGIGQLYASKAVDAQNLTLKNISDKALNYLDEELVKPRDAVFIHQKSVPNYLSSIEIHGWYTRSYFAQKPMSENLKSAWKKYQQKANAAWPQLGTYEKGMVALTFIHFKQVKEAQQIIKSLIETAQQSEEMGMYWPRNQLGYFWYQNPVETQSLLIELFAEAGKTKEVEEMEIWLLRNKQTNNWKTTTATAQACYALLLRGENWLQSDGKAMLFLGGKNLQKLKPEIKIEAGTGYFKTSWNDAQIKPELGKVEVRNQSKTISWGTIYWQYLEKLDKISGAKNSISLERKYFIRSKNNNGEVLVAVDKNHQPKVGDLLKIVVYLKADRNFEYVHLKDMRPAGTEPVDVISGYKYQDGLYYYQVTKDVATNFFISYLPKGNYVFEYNLRVAQPGSFSTGISSVQSMYAPEFGAHSEGKRLKILK